MRVVCEECLDGGMVYIFLLAMDVFGVFLRKEEVGGKNGWFFFGGGAVEC